jgi:hypothetical protein
VDVFTVGEAVALVCVKKAPSEALLGYCGYVLSPDGFVEEAICEVVPGSVVGIVAMVGGLGLVVCLIVVVRSVVVVVVMLPVRNILGSFQICEPTSPSGKP